MPNLPSPEQILAQQAHIARAARLRHQAEKEQARDNRTQYGATILGFDADTGLYRCQLLDGTIIYARSIGSSSAGTGDAVSLSKNQGTNKLRHL